MRSRITGIASAVLLLLCFVQCDGATDRRPNVVIIALDTLRPDHLGCYGYARDTSPHIDAWSKHAVVFEHAESAAPWTAPSLLSLMTSLYPNVHGVARFPDPGRMNDRVTTLAEVLKKHGYKTGAFTDGGYAKAQFGLGQGFDVYPLNHGDLPQEHSSNLKEPDRLRPNVDRALAWLSEVEAQPFFLFFHTYEVHVPYRPPASYVKLFRPSYDEDAEHAQLAHVIKTWIDEHKIDADGVRLIQAHKEHCSAGNGPEAEGLAAKAKELGVGDLEPARMQFWRDLYDGEIRHADDEIQRLLERLEAPALADNTIVVFVSDHGEGFGEHGHVGHGNVLYTEDLRVLFMLRAPGITPRRVNDIVRSVDVMPTVLDLAVGSRGATGMQGRSLVALLRGESLASLPAFGQGLSRRNQEARLWSVRDGQWRYVWDEVELAGRLFDLEADPGELHDVASEHTNIAERLLELLRKQRDLDAAARSEFSGPVGGYAFDAATVNDLKKLGYVDGEQDNADASRPALPIPTFGESGPVEHGRGQSQDGRAPAQDEKGG